MEINLKTLNLQQKQAVTHDNGPLLIVAGAGTGKTTVITQRIGWLVEQKKCRGDEILALTFTDKAAGEMEERVDKLMPYGYIDLWILTFHAFAEKVLKENALEIGIPNDFKLLNQTEQWLMVRKNLDRFDLDIYKPLGNPTKFIHALIKLFSRAKDEVITPQDYLDYAKDLKLNADSVDFIRDIIDEEAVKSLKPDEQKELMAQEIKKVQEISSAYHTYQQLLLENNALDFGDLINYCLQLFKTRPAVLARYRQKFKYILVDEFQDTNFAQYELIKLLVHPKNNITVVGDDDQSIYKFRGASVSNILEFKKDYPEAKEIFLNSNYRSTQQILDLAYKFIQLNNPDRLEVKLAELATKNPGAKKSKLTKKLTSNIEDIGLIKHLPFETADDEIRGVLKQIVDLKEKDKDALWSDFAILSRTNDVANSFVGAIAQTKIPFQFFASRGLYSKPVVLDILAYLKLLDNYHEGPATYRVLNFSIFNLSSEEINNLVHWANRKGQSIFHFLKKTITMPEVEEDLRERIKKIIALVDKHSQQALDKNVSEVVITFLEESGYLAELTKKDTLATQEAISHLNQFYKKIQEFENGFDNKSVKNFLELIDLELEAGEAGSLQKNLDEGPDSVKIMTIHSAKGLEFKYVFIVNLVDRRFPTTERRDPIELPNRLIKEILPEGDAHLQEERRLFYVAMTRAKSGLFFTTAYDCGGARRKKLSQFLLELKALGFSIQDEEKTKKGEGLTGEKIKEIGQEVVTCEDLTPYFPENFSFSQLKAFETCPYQYRFAHILKVPVRGKGSFSFGKTIHAALQQFYNLAIERASVVQTDLFGHDVSEIKSDSKIKKATNKKNKPNVSFEELMAIYENAWIDDWYTSRKDHDGYKAKGKKALAEFYKEIENNFIIPKFLELPFTFRIEENDQVYGLKGVIDRLDEVEGGFSIVDYKTGQGKTEKTFQSEDKEQLLIYQLASQQLFAEAIKNLSFFYIETGNKISFLGTQKELDNIKKKIVKTIDEIKLCQFPPKPGMMCQFCDFKNICEFKD